MKFAIGLMACIAIAFLFITSPDRSRSHAQEEVVAAAPMPAPKAEVEACSCDCDGKCADLEQRVAALEAVKNLLSGVAVSGGSTGGPVISYGSSGGPLISSGDLTRGPVIRTPVKLVIRAATNVATAPVRAAANYTPRWQNYDGKSRMQHAVDDHGMNISGKSQSQVLAEMDAYHDKYGPGHPVRVNSSSPVRQPVYSNGNCPGGVCPTGPSVQSRSSGNGWFLGKNLRR